MHTLRKKELVKSCTHESFVLTGDKVTSPPPPSTKYGEHITKCYFPTMPFSKMVDIFWLVSFFGAEF